MVAIEPCMGRSDLAASGEIRTTPNHVVVSGATKVAAAALRTEHAAAADQKGSYMSSTHGPAAQAARHAPLVIERRARNAVIDRRMSNQVELQRIAAAATEIVQLADRCRCRDHIDAKLLSGLEVAL